MIINFVEKWIKKLNLEEFRIGIKIEDSNEISHIGWRADQEFFLFTLTNCKHSGKHQTIIHELGHLLYPLKFYLSSFLLFNSFISLIFISEL